MEGRKVDWEGEGLFGVVKGMKGRRGRGVDGVRGGMMGR
jgi:hypothetical protein